MTSTKQSSDAIDNIIAEAISPGSTKDFLKGLKFVAGSDQFERMIQARQAIEKLLLAARIDENTGEVICQDCGKKTTFYEAEQRIHRGRSCAYCGGRLVKDMILLEERRAELQSLLNKTGESE